MYVVEGVVVAVIDDVIEVVCVGTAVELKEGVIVQVLLAV